MVRPAPVQAGHQSHLRVFERAHNPPQIARGDANVAVIHQKQGVTGGLRQFHQNAHFPIGRLARAAHQPDPALGELGHHPAHFLNRRVGRIGGAEYDLELRVVLRGVR